MDHPCECLLGPVEGGNANTNEQLQNEQSGNSASSDDEKTIRTISFIGSNTFSEIVSFREPTGKWVSGKAFGRLFRASARGGFRRLCFRKVRSAQFSLTPRGAFFGH